MSKPWTPHPYQLSAVEFGVKNPCCGIILDPGMGKTTIALAVVSVCIQAGDVHRVLVVAPIRVCQTVWPEEVEKWSDFEHLDVYDMTEWTPEGRTRILSDKSIQIVCINPDSLKLVLNHPKFASFGFDMLVIDESTKFKDSTTARFKVLKKHLYRFKRRLILTGTMRPNGLVDLFGQMYILDLGKTLGEYITHFRMNYMYSLPNQPYSYEIRPGQELIIHKLVKPWMLRYLAKDHLKMPDLVKNNRVVELPKQHREAYKQLDKHYVTTVNEVGIAAPTAATAGMKCRQFADGFIYWSEKIEQDGKVKEIRHTERIHDAKLDELEQLLDELNERPLLLAYEFQEDARAIAERFPYAVDLGQIANVRETVEKFNRGEIRLLMGHPASVGHGLNLQGACSTVCFFTPIWDLELYEQFYRRVWRQGQNAPVVIVHHIVCKNTRDAKVAAALLDKEVDQAIFDAALVSSL